MIHKFGSIRQITGGQSWAPRERTKEASLLHFVHQTSNKHVITSAPLPSRLQTIGHFLGRGVCDLTATPGTSTLPNTDIYYPGFTTAHGAKERKSRKRSCGMERPGRAILGRKGRLGTPRSRNASTKTPPRCSRRLCACNASKNNSPK